MKKQSNQKKKSHKTLWIILAIVAVLVIGIVILVVRAIGNMAEQLQSAMTKNTATVETGEIEVTTDGIGVAETAESTTVYLDYNAALHRIYKQNGERAAAGEVIAEFDSIALDEAVSGLESQLAQIDSQLSYMKKFGPSTVTAPVAGRVKQLLAGEGDSVLSVQNQQGALAVISADGNLKVEFTPQAAAEEGQKVTVLYGEESISGYIRELTGNRALAIFEDSAEYEIGTQVTVQTEDGEKLGEGTVECGHAIYVTADSGTIKSVSVKLNDKVSAGASLFKLKDVAYSSEYLDLLEQREQLSDKLKGAGAYKRGYVVTAEKDCIISGLSAKEGDMLPAGTPLCTLLDSSAFQVVLNIDELDIQGIEAGQQVEVTVDAIPDQMYEGTVTGVSLAGENNGSVGIYQVTVLLKQAENILPGMSANGKITKEHKESALLVPIDTLQTIDGKKCVNVLKEDGSYEKREVTVGLVNNEYAEILNGVREGEKLQVIVKLEDIYSQLGISMENTGMQEGQ